MVYSKAMRWHDGSGDNERKWGGRNYSCALASSAGHWSEVEQNLKTNIDVSHYCLKETIYGNALSSDGGEVHGVFLVFFTYTHNKYKRESPVPVWSARSVFLACVGVFSRSSVLL